MSMTLTGPLYCLLPAILSLFLLYGHSDAVSVWGSGDISQTALWDDYAAAYLAKKDSVDILFITDTGSSGLSRFTGGGVVYTVLGAVLTPNVTASVKNTYAGKDILQMPYLGTAMVAGYNLPTLVSGDPTLVLSGEVLARIYLGQIRFWNDSAIAALNTDLASAGKLPAYPILLSAYWDQTLEVFGNMMCEFSSAFEAAYESVGRNLTLMPPNAEGRMTIGLNHTDQATFVSDIPYGLAYMDLTYALRANISYASMVNQANATVSPTVSSIQTAMEASSANIQNGTFTLDLTNAPQVASWPMSYLLYITLSTNLTDPVTGCPSVKELLSILFWIETNTAAVNLATENSYSILPVPLFRLLLNAFPIIQCDSQESFSTAAVIGVGAPFEIYPSWADEESSNTEAFQYYSTTDADAVSNMIQGFTDFGGLDVEPTSDELAQMPDVVLVPMVAYAVAPAYSVGSVFAYGSLRFDLPTLADIYLGNILYWNDTRIATLNVNLTAYLPSAPICVIYQTNPSMITQLFTTVLADNVPRFAAQITPGLQVSFPNLNPCSIGVDGNIIDYFSQPNSIGMWIVPDIIPSLYAGPSFIITSSGNRSSPQPSKDIALTLQEYQNPLAADQGIFQLEGRGPISWPFVVGSAVMIHTRPKTNCAASTALLDWIWWSQTDTFAIQMADNYGMAVASVNAAVQRRILNTLASVTCDGVATFSLAGCVFNGTFCSNRGSCTNGICACNSGFDGSYCENVATSDNSLSTGAVLGIVLGVLLPLVCVLLIVVPLIVVAIVLFVLRLTKRKPEWEINPDEVEIGEPLGMGGYGSVYKARWRGSEVAVKMLPSHNPSKEMIKNFRDEIHVMMALRHPNVVLFMAASTGAEKMCLVMEFMALGSLFDVLHNELIPDIPHALKVKLAYQASKGMHFLHSSGIVHRDLKSLNLLLDAKWNVKVSDFGLTRLKQEIKTGKDGNEGLGSIPWTAPEVLNDQPELDYVLADVYSFGIILWELLTRSQPYPGLSPAAVAVAVIRDDARPELPDDGAVVLTPEYDELMRSCWHSDPSIRPTFLEIVTRLSSMTGEMSSSSQGGSSSSTASIYNINSGHSSTKSMSTSSKRTRTRKRTMSKAGSSNASSANSSVYNYPMTMMTRATVSDGGTAVRIQAPMGEIAIVFTDITSAASLWEFNAEAMKDATLAHNQLLRSLLAKHRGYEVRSTKERNSGEGSFCLVFQEATEAVEWCLEAQKALLEVEWPPALLEHPGAAEEWGDTDDRVLFKGLRVRMGLHVGEPRMAKHPTTRKMEYFGAPVNTAARITAMTHGGQVVVSDALRAKFDPKDRIRVLDLGKFEMPDSPNGAGHLYEFKVPGLEGRFFGGVTTIVQPRMVRGDGASTDDLFHRDTDSDDHDAILQTAVGEGLTDEDRFLNSANLCRWVINFNEIQMGKQIGMGSYGVVYKGTWKGVDVAVKRFIKQNLDERRLLEFRAEMAFLSELHHPNVVLFIGACVRMPNLCIVTEFVKQGCLKDVLSNRSVKLTWNQRLRMLKSAALGVNYLHTLNPCIIHRDLKPSNLLVDENWNVKIADFGFARIKEENATMTRCGTPCWTAPEVIRGEKYTEKADVYSFGVIMWEMLTRKQPFAGRNFMGVSLDVLEGRRPALPSDCPEGFGQMVERCWHAKADKRPAMGALLDFFDSLIGETSRGLNAV